MLLVTQRSLMTVLGRLWGSVPQEYVDDWLRVIYSCVYSREKRGQSEAGHGALRISLDLGHCSFYPQASLALVQVL